MSYNKKRRFFKILYTGRTSNFQNWQWPRIGNRTPLLTDVKHCEHGYHLCDAESVMSWCEFDEDIYVAQGFGEHIHLEFKSVFGQACLLANITPTVKELRSIVRFGNKRDKSSGLLPDREQLWWEIQDNYNEEHDKFIKLLHKKARDAGF
jgi:hypothetical protein